MWRWRGTHRRQGRGRLTAYSVPAGPHRTQRVVDRSRFIATLARAPDVPAARAVIDAVRAEFPDATHNCWAYVAGPPGSTAHIGLSDAGEPHGSAGRPMLDVLLHSGIGEIVAVVTRYYGGVKLGKGGLVRAYGGSVQDALVALPTVERVERLALHVVIGYSDLEPVRRALAAAGAHVVAEEFTERVVLRVHVPVAAADGLKQALADCTGGQARVTAAELEEH
jgi:uncharacterized YigZ family protein